METFAPNPGDEWAIVRLVTDAELTNALFVKDVKTFFRKMPVPRRQIVEFFADGLRDATAHLVDDHGVPVEIDLEEIERDNIDLWFRDWLKATDSPRMRAESRERVRLVATLLRMIFPKESRVWGNP